jgi:hypothetical protein
MGDEARQISISISIDEWQNIFQWMHWSLGPSESEASGHFLLEIVGEQRTWVTTDNAQLTVLHLVGPKPTANFELDEPLTILVNSRFFRGKTPEDVILTVTEIEDRRYQTLRGQSYEQTLPEHPGKFPDWKEALNLLSGTQVQIESEVMLQACHTANTVPWGIEYEGLVAAWLHMKEGKLCLETPWYKYPHTQVLMNVSGQMDDSVPVYVSPARLSQLLLAITPAEVTLTLPHDPLGMIGVTYGDYQALLMPLDRWADEKAKLEELLCEFLRVEEVTPDDDGDYGITTPEGHQMWIRLQTEFRPISAQIFSVLASDVPCSNELLAELNSINASAPFVKVMWASDAIMAETDIVAESLDLAELANALTVVQETVDRYIDLLSVYFAPQVGNPDDSSD